MNNYRHTHTPHNNEQRPDDESTDTAQHRSDAPEYQLTIEHGSIWLGQECVASAVPDAYCPEMRS